MSGTMWLGRVVVDLCFLLCGNPRNSWCKMGELLVIPDRPVPVYSFEMLHADTGELLLQFKGTIKHEIPGLEVNDGCNRGSYAHPRGLGKHVPCQNLNPVTREGLAQCLPDISPLCMPRLPRLDPDLRRMAVVFRDPRNLVISEHGVRTNSFEESVEDIGVLEPFILDRFEIIVQWIHQRWVWHTTFLKTISHVMFYEDLQAHPGHLQDLAAFLGLDCTPVDAAKVLETHQYWNPREEYASAGLTFETMQWMNATMAAILPEDILTRYGLRPTDT